MSNNNSTEVATVVMPSENLREEPKLKFMDAEEERKLFLQRLAELNGQAFSGDTGVDYHEGSKISLPIGMTPAKGSEILNDVATALAQTEVFTRTFKYRPWDGAHAVRQVMLNFFGTSGRGKTIETMFGPIKPRQIEIEINAEGGTAQVPWGHIQMAQFEGTLMLGGAMDSEYGMLFQLSVECPKQYAASVAGFFQLIEHELRTNSIYKGKSIKGTDEPRFIPTGSDPTIVYSDDVMSALETTVWGVIRNADLLLADKKKVNNRILLHGPYGTGKSEAGRLTSQIANEHGWTFINFHSGKSTLDDLEKTIQTARLYSPAVVFIEDIDVYASQEGMNAQTRITNLFDGIGSKGDKVMIVMTSNRAADFSKGMLRAGRVDRMIYVGPLDRPATEQLIKRVIGDERLGDIDFDAVWKAMDGFEPAFVRQTFDQAASAALIRTGSRQYLLNTEDFVTAANLLRPQHELHSTRSDDKKELTLDTQLATLVKRVIAEDIKLRQVDDDGDLLEHMQVETVEH